MKNMKTLIKKVAGSHHLTFEELYGVLTAAESTLNSRPLLPLDSTSPDGTSPLTPGHFLIGRPLPALPSKADLDPTLTPRKRWDLVERLRTNIWSQWYSSITDSPENGEVAVRSTKLPAR